MLHWLTNWRLDVGAAAVALLLIAFFLIGRRSRSMTRRAAVLQTLLDIFLIAAVGAVLMLTLRPGHGLGELAQFNLIPFRDVISAVMTGSPQAEYVLINVLGNLALFLPLGLAMALRWPQLALRRGVTALVLFSLGIELAQLTLAGRLADVTDVLTNAAGGAAGIVLGRVRWLADPVPAR